MAATPIRTLYIVPREHEELYVYLKERFSTDPAVEVILDRRMTRVSGELLEGRVNRRHHAEIDVELQTRSHAILTLPAEPAR